MPPECSLEDLDYDFMRKLLGFMEDNIALEDKQEIATNEDFVLAMQNERFRKIAYSHGIFWDQSSQEWAFGTNIQEALLMSHIRMLKDKAELPVVLQKVSTDEQVEVESLSSSCRAIVEGSEAKPQKLVKLALLMGTISSSVEAEVKKRPRANCRKRSTKGTLFGTHHERDKRKSARWKVANVHRIKAGGELSDGEQGRSRGRKQWEKTKQTRAGGDWPRRGERKKGNHNSTLRKRIEIADYAIKISEDGKGYVDDRVASQFPEKTRQLKQTGRVQTDACDILSKFSFMFFNTHMRFSSMLLGTLKFP